MVLLGGLKGVAGTLWDIDLFFPAKYLSAQNSQYTDYLDITSKYQSECRTGNLRQAVGRAVRRSAMARC